MMTAEVAKAPATRGTSRNRGGKRTVSLHPDVETHAALKRIRHHLSSPDVKATMADAVHEAVTFYRSKHRGKVTGLEGGSAGETVFVDPEDYDFLGLELAPAILHAERRQCSIVEAIRVVVRFYVDRHPDLPQ